jgi:tryptophan-rich sensory protein
MKTEDIPKLIISILLCQGAGFVGSLFTGPALPTWYAFLEKPSFTPPAWLFGPVWFILYTLMGGAAYLVWHNGLEHRNGRIALFVFVIQLVLNAVWSFIFFGLSSLLFGFIEILLLLLAIILTIYLFYGISKVAGVLLVPYFLWTSFAALLNFSLWKLNS